MHPVPSLSRQSARRIVDTTKPKGNKRFQDLFFPHASSLSLSNIQLPLEIMRWLSSRRPAARRCWRSGLHGSSALPRPLACGRCVHHGDMWYANRRQGIVELHRWAGGRAVIDLLHLSGGALAAGRCWAGNWLGRGIPSPGPADATLCPWTAQNIVLLGCDYTSRIVAMCWLCQIIPNSFANQ